MKNFLIIGLCLCLTGCAQVPVKTVRPFDELQYGMPKLQLTDLLGKPDTIEIYKKSDLTRVEFYIYVNKNKPEGTVPVCLVDNKVVGWGKTFYEDHVTTDDTRIR